MKRQTTTGYINLMFWSDRGASRQLTIPRRWIRPLWICALGTGAMVLFFVGRYFYLEHEYRQRATLEAMRRRMAGLELQLNQSNERSRNLEQQLNDLNREIGRAAQTPPKQVPKSRFDSFNPRELSTANVNDLVDRVRQLNYALNDLQGRLQVTKRDVQSRLDSLEVIPSIYPVSSPSITSRYGWRRDPLRPGFADFHTGFDFSGSPGDHVIATASGRVVFAGWKS
ncbi:MAG: hypothetical protein ACREJQ_02495, partial [bacterium]